VSAAAPDLRGSSAPRSQTGITPSSTPAGPFGSADRLPTTVDPTSRYLRDQSGKPGFGIGDTAWPLIGQLSIEALDEYFEDPAATD
jgi:hypothetical protein